MVPILVPPYAKHMATQTLVIAKLNGRTDFLGGFVCDVSVPTRNYLFKVETQE